MTPYSAPGVDHNATLTHMIERIISEATGVYNIHDTSRRQATVKPRQIAMWLIRRHTKNSYAAISRRYRKNHATVIHACRTVDNMREYRDPDYYDLIQYTDRMVNLEKFRNHINKNTINV